MTQCLTCSPGFFYQADSLGNINCVRFCPDNFTQYRGYATTYNQTINNTVQSLTILRDQCVPCPSNCQTCNYNICLFCYSTYQYYQGACVSSCPNGTYISYGTCIACPLNCTLCNSNGCNNCTSGFILQNNQCYRLCSDLTTVLNTSATTCNTTCASPCLTCFGPSPIQCLTCSSSYLSFYNGSCLSSCPTNFSPISGVCVACPYGCSSCINAINCTNCNAGYYLTANQCVRLCPQATYPSVSNATTAATPGQNLCLPCPTGCQRCSDQNTCLQCAYNYNFFNFTCLTSNPDNY